MVEGRVDFSCNGTVKEGNQTEDSALRCGVGCERGGHVQRL